MNSMFNLTGKKRTTVMQDAEKHGPAIEIALTDAARDPALARTMYRQLNEARMTEGAAREYTASVDCCMKHYRVTGTHAEWASFFRMEPVG